MDFCGPSAGRSAGHHFILPSDQSHNTFVSNHQDVCLPCCRLRSPICQIQRRQTVHSKCSQRSSHLKTGPIFLHVALSKTPVLIFFPLSFSIIRSTLVHRRPCCRPCCQPQWCCSDGPHWRNVSCLRHVRLCVVPCRCLLRGFASLWRSRNQPRAHLPGSQTRRRPEGTDWRHYCSLREAWLQTRW